jgi:hypothetical protein
MTLNLLRLFRHHHNLSSPLLRFFFSSLLLYPTFSSLALVQVFTFRAGFPRSFRIIPPQEKDYESSFGLRMQKTGMIEELLRGWCKERLLVNVAVRFQVRSNVLEKRFFK